MRTFFFLVNIFLCAGRGLALVPGERQVLHTSTVYFEEDFSRQAYSYELRLFKDSIDRGVKPFRISRAKFPAFTESELPWGNSYFWRLVYLDSEGRETGKSPMHQFSIQQHVLAHFDESRLAVRINDTSVNAGGLVSVDYTRSLFTRGGYPVWTIPAADSALSVNVQIRDLRVTEDNTVTFLTGKAPVEIGLDGKVLWQAPWPFVFRGDSVQYHHDFQKTRRGTYMVLGMRRVYRPVTGTYDTTMFRNADSKMIGGKLFMRTQVTQLFEFDAQGKLIWFWDSNDAINDQDLNFKKTAGGISNFATHANAFGENADAGLVYVGFRDLSRIMKIDKKSKKVLDEYGEIYPSGRQKGSGLFRKQHGATVSRTGSLLILNNNSYSQDAGVSSVMELNTAGNEKEPLLLWRFDLDFDSLTKAKSVSGGNVTELPNGNLLVCAGTLNRIFEVNRNKKVVWDAFVEIRRKGEQRWEASPQYRANWTPGLRYHHFVAAIRKKGTDSVEVTLHNSGNAEDEYQVLALIKGKKVRLGEPLRLKAGRSEKRQFRISGDTRLLVRSPHEEKYLEPEK